VKELEALPEFCPANVYEMLDDPAAPNGKRISLNAANCVHCKTATFRTLPDHHLGSTEGEAVPIMTHVREQH